MANPIDVAFSVLKEDGPANSHGIEENLYNPFEGDVCDICQHYDMGNGDIKPMPLPSDGRISGYCTVCNSSHGKMVDDDEVQRFNESLIRAAGAFDLEP
tara:strand:+ start:136 stop:432 length:297 start_codon:yes stop_codon:yes gene_type:complete